MAKELGDLIVRLSLDSAKFDDTLKRLESQMTQVQKTFQSSATGLTNFDKVTATLKTSADTLTQRLAMQKSRVSELERAHAESARTKGTDAEETQKLAQKLEEARAKVAQTEKALEAVNQQIKLNQNGWYKLGVNLEGVGARLEAVGKKMSTAGTYLSTRITAPVVALGTACVKTFTDFDDAMRQVQATMAASDDDLAKLTATAKEMGAATRYTASEAAEALNYLALAGYNADQAIEALPQVLNLASAGGLDLAYASDLVTDSMSALGIEMSELTGFTDEMAKTSQKSNTNIAQLGEAILTVGGTAKVLAGGTVEMNTALGILADNGIKGAEGGTALRNMILSLSAPTDVAAQKMKALGLRVFDAQGNMRPMNEIFKDLNATLGTMTQEQRTEVLSTIFNKVDLKSATALLANCGTRFDELSGYIADSDGAAQKMADTMEGGIGGTFRNLESAVEGLAIALGERLAPYIKAIADKITEFARRLTELSPKTLDLIIKIAAIAAAVGPVLLIMGKLTTGVGGFMKILAPLFKLMGGAQAVSDAMGSALTALTGPVGIIAAAIAGLALLFVSLYNTNEAFRDKVNAVWAQICAAFDNVKGVFQNTFARMAEAFGSIQESLGQLWDTIVGVFGRLVEFVEPLLTQIGLLLSGFVATVIGVANGILNAIAPLTQVIISAVEFVTNILGALVALLQGDVSGAWEYLKAAVGSFGDFFMDLFNTIGAFFQGFWESLCAIAAGFGVNLEAFFTGLWTNIQAGATAAWDALTAWLSTTWESISATASTVWNTVCTNISTAVDAGVAAIQTAWDNVSTAVSTTWTTLQTTASTAWGTVCTNVNTAITSAQAGIQSAWTAISTVVSGVWTTLQTTASTAWGMVCTNVNTAITSAQAGIQSAWTAISTVVSGVWTTLQTTASTSWSTITNGVKTTISGAQSGIVSAWDGIKTAIKTTWDGITSIFQTPVNNAITWLNGKVAWLKGLFNFSWTLPSFKLPKIDVSWKEVGWGIKIPSLSLNWNALGGIFDKPTIFGTANAGLQGVGEAGPEAILPLKTLWAEMSVRLKSGMQGILRDAHYSQMEQENKMVRAFISALQEGRREVPNGTSVQVTQHIYANQTSYAGQQREAARQFRQIARAMG